MAREDGWLVRRIPWLSRKYLLKEPHFRRESVYPLEQMTWLNVTTYVPRDSPTVLRTIFGASWKTPIRCNGFGRPKCPTE